MCLRRKRRIKDYLYGYNRRINLMKWKELYNNARGKLNPRTISPFIDAGGVAAAILTDSGNVYTGV
ncbi:cytidine deaminase, partial [Clostridioides difficile]